MRRLRFILLLTAWLAIPVSCIYDFVPETDGSTGGILVVEGDILIGATTRIHLSETNVLSTKGRPERTEIPWAIVQLTAVKGALPVKHYDGYRVSNGDYLIDTETADPDALYYLVIHKALKGVAFTDTYIDNPTTGPALINTYCSEMIPVIKTAPIDSLSWEVVDEKNLAVRVSTGGQSGMGSRCLKWTARETWEYTAARRTEYYYDQATNSILPYPYGVNYYYCWKNADAPFLMIARMEDYEGDRLVDREIYRYGNQEHKLSYLYRVDVCQQNISEEAYRYWSVINKNTCDVGGLFSPQPTEIRGNIVNQDNPDEMVIGYLSASTVSTARLYISNEKTHFYKGGTPFSEESAAAIYSRDWLKYYRNGYWPFDYHQAPNQIQIYPDWWDWYPVRCLDCRVQGGTKNKPADWPNDHQ